MAAAVTLVAACAGTPSPRPAAPPDPDYVWNEMQAEKLQALRALGAPARGAVAFEVCQGCHRANALGRPDGSYPRLAGQHDTVLIKQLTDVRAGRRRNDKMLPFANHEVLSPQDIADIASYLTRLPVPPDHGKGPGDDLERGRSDYTLLCATCHGARGEGDAAKFYPRLSGQHFKYLLRESVDIRDGTRANANPRMREATRNLDDRRLAAIADYVSRLATD
jgi:cytochrome c553